LVDDAGLINDNAALSARQKGGTGEGAGKMVQGNGGRVLRGLDDVAGKRAGICRGRKGLVAGQYRKPW